MAFTVIYDACVLHPAPLRDLLIRVGMSGVVRVRWSERILDECFNSLLKRRPDLTREALSRTRRLMNRAVPDCLVTDYDDLVGSLELPDTDDRHVLAAAIRAGAQAIITFNLKDFPIATLAKYGMEAQHPDDFMVALLDLAPGMVAAVLAQQAAALNDPPMTIAELLELLQQQGLVQTSVKLKAMM